MAVEGGSGPIRLRPPADFRLLAPEPEPTEAGTPASPVALQLTTTDALESSPARTEAQRRIDAAQSTLNRTALTEALRPGGTADGSALYGAAKGFMRETILSMPENELPLGLGTVLRSMGLVGRDGTLRETGDRLEARRDELRDDGRAAWSAAYDESPVLSLAAGGLVAAAGVAALGRVGTNRAHLDDLGLNNFQTRLWQGSHLRVDNLSFERNFGNLGGDARLDQEIDLGANRLGLSLASQWAGGDAESHTATARWQRGATAVQLGGTTDGHGDPSGVRFGLAYSGFSAEVGSSDDAGVSAHATYERGGLILDLAHSREGGDVVSANYGWSF